MEPAPISNERIEAVKRLCEYVPYYFHFVRRYHRFSLGRKSRYFVKKIEV